MIQHKPTSSLLRRIALIGTLALLAAPTTSAYAAASPSPSPNTRPAPTGTARPAAPRVVTTPKPLPANAPKPGVVPHATSRAALAARAPATAASASLPATTCTLTGAVRLCDLWALAGTIPVAGGPATGLPVWGFSTDGATVQVPGPTLIASTRDVIQINLHNLLPAGAGNLSLEVPAAQHHPDLGGIATGQTRLYSFGPLPPGTYLYEAGATPDAPRQIRMGLSGLLIVRPLNFLLGTNQSAYGGTMNDTFTAEAVAELNEFDPVFNADPFGADPIDYHSTLFLLNGRTFDPANPTLGAIDVGPGDALLLHEANLGPHDRGLTILNERQQVLADDSSILRNPADVATKWTTPGQVSDSFVTVDPQAPLGTHIPVFESGFHLSNDAASGLGGAMTYLDVVKGLGGSPGGPVSAVTVQLPAGAGAPNFSGTQDLTFSGKITPSSGALTAEEWFLDGVGAPGSGNSFASTANGSCTAPPAGGGAFSCTIPAATLNALVTGSPPVDGDHIIWVHAQDGSPNGGWGVASGDVFTINLTGPDTDDLSIHVTPTNGGRQSDVANGAGPGGANQPVTDVVLLGTAAASLSDWVVLGGEYCLDATTCANGAGTPLVTTPGPTSGAPAVPAACVPPPPPPGTTAPAPGPAPGGAPLVSFCATVPTSVLNGLSEGVHTLHVHAYEAPNQAGSGSFGAAPGRWGPYSLAGASISFVIDRTGPAAGSVTLDPNPNNGKVGSAGNLNFLDSLQVTGTFDDSATGGSNIAYGEVFVTSTTASAPPVAEYGTGAEMIPRGAKWDSPTKVAYGYIPLAELTAYPEGLVRFWVHAADAAGNWGTWAFADLTVDRTPPLFVYGPGLTPPDGGKVGPCAAGCSITLQATDPVSGGVHSNIVQAEWFVDQGAHYVCDPTQPGCNDPDVIAPGDPGQGSGTPISITPGFTVTATFATGPQPPGTKIVFRVRDAAGNWSKNTFVVTT